MDQLAGSPQISTDSEFARAGCSVTRAGGVAGTRRSTQEGDHFKETSYIILMCGSLSTIFQCVPMEIIPKDNSEY